MSNYSNLTFYRRAILTITAAGTLALGACGSDEVEAPPEGVVPGLEVTNARLVLPPVEGNPAAVYFDVVYNGERGVSISGAEVTGAASAMVHNTFDYDLQMQMGDAGPIALPKGESKTFEPGGLHVMAFELGEGFEPGSSAEVSLRISGGKMHKFEAEVLAAGDER